jgi:hypothetical protein
MRSVIDPAPEAEPAAAASPPDGGALARGTRALGAPAAGIEPCGASAARAGPRTGAPRPVGAIGLERVCAALAGPP